MDMGLFQNQLIESEISHGPFQSAVLSFEFFESLGLIDFQPSVLVAPAIISLSSTTQGSTDLHNALPFAQHHLGFTQFGKDLFDGMTQTWHATLRSAQP